MGGIISKYGNHNIEAKLVRLSELQKPAISIIEEHTQLLEDVCGSYVSGNFYSALTGACCLGERIFNNIIFKVLDDFKSSKYYKKVYRKDSLLDWQKAIDILSAWKIIDSKTRERYLQLYKLRTESIHFQKKEQDASKMSAEAINIINFIIGKLFGITAERKDILLYFNVPGEIYINKCAESNPIVRHFFIPCANLVGPNHVVTPGNYIGQFKIIDDNTYEDREIDDEEFVKLRISKKNK